MIQIRLKAGKLPLSTPIGTAQDILDRDAKYLQIESGDTASVVVIGVDEPSADDRDKPWIKLDGDGRPLGVYVYFDGAWKLPAYVAPTGTFGMYTGIWDVKGASYPGWLFADGTNGTIDVRIRMLKADNSVGTDATSATNLKLGIMQYIG